MKKVLLFTLLFISHFISAQEVQVSEDLVKKDLYFIASDELKGRKTGSPENVIAAKYIAESFRASGLKVLEGAPEYLQSITFENRKPTDFGKMTVGDTSLLHGEDILMLTGRSETISAQLVFAEQAWVDDTTDQLAGLDLEGKVVLSLFGVPGSQNLQAGMSAVRAKRMAVKERGAVGLIEVYNSPFPWTTIKRFLNREQTSISDNDTSEVNQDQFILSEYKFSDEIKRLRAGETVSVTIENNGVNTEKVNSPNVAGFVEGTDEEMKDEYIILSAHFDHVGTTNEGDDKIFNGARDNGIGVSAILAAARYFGKNPPKRSILFLGFTAEEIGLVGSQYYVDNPLLPLNKAIFNLNIDGAGYNDTTRVSVIGHDRVGVLDIFKKATAAAGLTVGGDPAPEQGLFDRSDNVRFAAMGIPAPTYAPGMTAFDAEIMKYYHQVTDNPETVSIPYVTKYIHSYILTAQMIAERQDQPKWKEGDKYEEAFNALYGKD